MAEGEIAGEVCFFMGRKRTLNKFKSETKSADWTNPNVLIAMVCGVAIFQYVEFVFFSAVDENGHTADIPMWRVHMGSTCFGTAAFVVAIFCCEALEHKSKKRALRFAIPWLPLLGLTALATIIHFPIFIVIILGLSYGGWVYVRSRTGQRRWDGQ